MRQPALAVVAVVGALAFLGCPKKEEIKPTPAPVAPTPPPVAPPPTTMAPLPKEPPPPTVEELNRDWLRPIRFDFDKSDVREGDRVILQKDAEILKQSANLDVQVTIEGHCDERGTVEYNIALGDRRAKATRDYLVSLGVAANRLKTISYGKEAPLCKEHDEDCWARNRRAMVLATSRSK